MSPRWTVFCTECQWQVHVHWQWWGFVRFFFHATIEQGIEWLRGR